MPEQSADEHTIERIVQEQIVRDGEHRRGPKRDVKKITRILTLILMNYKLRGQPLTIKEIKQKLPDIRESDLRDHLAFLSKFPQPRPFLNATRRQRSEMDVREPGAPLIEYSFDYNWILEWRMESKPRTLTACMRLD